MNLFMKGVLLLLCILVYFSFKCYVDFIKPQKLPELNKNFYWGPGSASSYKENKSVKKFEIKISSKIISDLQSQLSIPFKYVEPLEGTAFEYGFNTKKLEHIISYWRDVYLPKWSEREVFMNMFPHFTTEIQGLQIHFVRVAPKQVVNRKVVPVLLLHGWPGSIREFYDIIPMFSNPHKELDVVFEIIAPSLPGYGFSQAPSKKHFGPTQAAIVLRNLMLRLGHERFIIQGGDWGSVIGSHIATIFPENTIGYHSNMCVASGLLNYLKWSVISLIPGYFLEEHQYSFHLPIFEKLSYLLEEFGYFHLQATKPDTIGVALSNNPVGLAAYILEKFSTWTHLHNKHNIDGGLEKSYTLDSLLDNVMIYFLTNSITTSQRLYAEHFSKEQRKLQLDRVPTSIPTGCARFKWDLLQSSDWQLQEKYTNIVHSSYYQNGGHFAAMEVPKVLYDDFVKFVKKLAT